MRISFGKMHLGVNVTLLLLCLQGILTELPPKEIVQVSCPLIGCDIPCSVEEEYERDGETGCQTSCKCVPKMSIAMELPPVDSFVLDDQVVCPMVVVECEDGCEKRTDTEGCDVCICPEPEIACAVPMCINDCGLFG
ncbi:unnamed protein product, partial [Owenia fusiformis]